MMPLETLVLDQAQERVAYAAADARMLVVAGAGRGKTEVVCRRIQYLIDEEGLSPVDEIVVLSFSRAAVEVVHRRLASFEQLDATIRTFDSFAARLLLEADDGQKLPQGFDERIRAATERIRDKHKDPPFALQDIRHLIVDEAQDLVGDRAEFVEAILEKLDAGAGFTVLGDPLQAIYDFQLTNSRSKRTSTHMFDHIRALPKTAVVDLDRNYRARGKTALAVNDLGNRLRPLNIGDDARSDVDDLLATLDDLGDFRSATWILKQNGGSTAVLTRTNADALMLSQIMLDQGLRHTVRRTSQELGPQPWVARALADVSEIDLEEEDALELIEGIHGAPEPEHAWLLLREAAGARRGNTVNMRRLRSILRPGTAPWALLGSAPTDLIVSTIHRAKGLEFDRVLLVNGMQDYTDVVDQSVRSVYVALSRARDDTMRATVEQPQAGYRRGVDNRWTGKAYKGPDKKRSVSVEMRPGDVEDDIPYFDETVSAPAVQQRLAEPSLVGTRARAVLEQGTEMQLFPTYRIMVEQDLVIGRTTEQFGRDFGKTFWRPPGRKWPSFLNNLVVTAVESTVGEPEYSAQAGIGRAGLWLVPRVLGLATPKWGE